MIEKYELYSVKCDLCGTHYPGKKAMPDHPVIYFPGKAEAYAAIKDAGWCVMHNQEDFTPQILCPYCDVNIESELNQKHEELKG